MCIKYKLIFSAAFDIRLSVCILKLPEGLDYSRITDEEETGYQSSADLTLTQYPTRSDFHHHLAGSGMMRVDSNNSISHINVQDSIVSTSFSTIGNI